MPDDQPAEDATPVSQFPPPPPVIADDEITVDVWHR